MRMCTKYKRKHKSNTNKRGYPVTPGRPSHKYNERLTPTHGTHDMHETKTQTKTKPITWLRRPISQKRAMTKLDRRSAMAHLVADQDPPLIPAYDLDNECF